MFLLTCHKKTAFDVIDLLMYPHTENPYDALKETPIKEAGKYKHNYNDELFLTLFLYFSYRAEASNLRCKIVLLVTYTYCVQNMK